MTSKNLLELVVIGEQFELVLGSIHFKFDSCAPTV